MHNVAPSIALVRRSRQLLQLAFLLVSGGTFIAVVGLAMFILPLAPLADTSFQALRNAVFIFGVLVGVIGLALAVRAFTYKTDNDLAKITGDFLSQYLDDRYTFIRNVSKRGLGYIDAVLVGPPGALVFRIVGQEGVFFNQKGNWLRRGSKNDWIPMRFNPTKQAVEDIQHLRQYLAKRGATEKYVYGVVVFTKEAPAVQITTESPVVPVAQLSDIMLKLKDNYLAKERIDPSAIDAIVKTLFQA